MSLSLSAEILDHILSFLQSDKATLEVCSRSHPTLSQLAERHLYAIITIQNNIDNSPDDFLKVLCDRPHIANYVFALEIQFVSYKRDPKAFLEEVSSVFPKLLMLRRIQLSNIRSRTFHWHMLPEKFRLAFLDCLRLPSVMHICIEYIAFPLSILNQCTHISYLYLRGWEDDPTITAGGDNRSLPTIDALALHRCYPDSLSKITTWIQSQHLSSLEFSEASSRPSLDLLPRILVGCSDSLTSLDVDISGHYGSYYDFNLSQLTHHPQSAIAIPHTVLHNLQHLTIRARMSCIDDKGRGLADWAFLSPIFAIAEILKQASSLRRLTLDFQFFITTRDYYDAQDRITDVLCDQLHSLLVESPSTIESIIIEVSSVQDAAFVPPKVVISRLSSHTKLAEFVDNGELILKVVDTGGST